MLETILGALLPAVITILLGYFAARHHDFEQSEVPTLNRMVMSYALPLALFVGVVSVDRDKLVADAPLVIILAIAFVGMYAVALLLCRFLFRCSWAWSALGALTVSAPSTAFTGSVVLGYIYGAESDIPVAVGTIVIVVTLLPLTLMLLSLESDDKSRARGAPTNTGASLHIGRRLLSAFEQPVVWLPLIGFAITLSGYDVPEILQNSLALLGHASSGVALFSSGIIIGGYRVTVSAPVLSLVFAKNIVQPAMVWGGMFAFGYANPLLGQAVLTSALPVMVLVVMLAVQYRIATREMASALFFSTIASLITVSAFIVLAAER